METLIEPLMTWILAMPNAVHILTFLVAAASLVAALSPTIKNSSKWVWVQRILDIVALNLANAKDKGDNK